MLYVPTLVIVNVLVYFATLHIEHIDEHFNIAEYVIALGGKVVLHKRLLSTAVPQVEHKVAQKADVRLFDIDFSSKGNKLKVEKQFNFYIGFIDP